MVPHSRYTRRVSTAPPTLSDRVTAPRAAIERALEDHLDRAGLPANLGDAIRYALLGGGKRLRPLLAWHCAAAVSGEGVARDGSASLPAGVAVELIHAFSLVHDDLPAMDDDDMRRGRPTLHVHAGEAMAILAGDAMTVLAFQAIEPVGHPALHIALSKELASGTLGMIVGQVYDTLGGTPPAASAAERVALIHRNKTGALIRAACRMGAMLGGASDDALARLTEYADAIGLMFQIVDDILDVTQPAEALGKRSGKDSAAGKATFPGVIGLDGSRAAVARQRDRAIEAARALGTSAGTLVELADYMALRTA